MRFTVTTEEAKPVARAVAKYFGRLKMKVRTEVSAWNDAPYRTTLVLTAGGLQVLVECQGSPSYGGPLRDLVAWLSARRLYAEVYLATTSDASVQASLLHDIQDDGVGLILVGEDGTVAVNRQPRNPALVVTPEPTLVFGDCKGDVQAALRKFNESDRKGGLRDMCELVERETERIGLRAARKGWLTKSEAVVEIMSWSDQINYLASAKNYTAGRTPLLSSELKDDLHSFRGARKLVDHNVKSKREDIKRQRQFTERMVQGPRLVAELVSIRRRIS